VTPPRALGGRLGAALLLAACWAAPSRAGVRTDTHLMLDCALAGARAVCVGERGRVLLGGDGGDWAEGRSGTEATLTAVFFHDERLGWAVGHDGVILRTQDGGASWTTARSAPEEEKPLLDVWFSDARRGFAAGAYGLFLESSDGGATWTPRKVLEDDRHLNALAGGADGNLFVAGESGLLLRSSDGGRTFKALQAPYQGSYFGLLRAGRDLLLFGLRGRLFRSADLGRTWGPVKEAGEATWLGGSVGPDGEAVLAGYGGSVLTTRDGGRTAALRQRPDAKALSAALRLPGGGLLLAGEAGLAVEEAAP